MIKGKATLMRGVVVLVGIFFNTSTYSMINEFPAINCTTNNTILNFSRVGLINYNSNSNSINIDLTVLLLLCVILVAAFVVTNFVFRNKQHKHIKNERNMMSGLIDNLPDTIYFKDLNSKFIRVNKAQAELLKLSSPDEAIGKSDYDYFEHAQQAYEEEQEIIRTGTPLINRIYEHTVNGEQRFLSDTKIPLYDEDKKCSGTVGITRDITEFVNTKEAMHEHQAKFQALFENAPLAIFRLDKNLKVVEYNHRFRTMFGYSNEQMQEVTQYDLLADAELGELILETIKETKEASAEIMLKRANGQEFIANLTLALLDEGFKEITIEGTVEDITQVAKARDEIIKAKDQAVEADKLKSLFLANMSHEIRTPMNAIIGFSNMLKEEDLTIDDRNSFIDVIQSNGNSLMTLIDSIVDFSKLESEQMVVSFGEFNFKPLFDSACEYAENLLRTEEKFDVKVIRTQPEEPNIRIKSDRHRLNQVLNHLISNAVKFTDHGEIELGYKHDGEKFIIVVRDTGIGIAPKDHSAIFNRFTKVSNNKDRLYSGTGIGLTISKGLIELMKGNIKVESETGKGATFTIEM